MTDTTVKIIADSSFNNHRIVTFQLHYPRFIHSELMTHRVFSRNARSSRATPVAKNIQDVLNDPAMPVEWNMNESGMVGNTLASDAICTDAEAIWKEAANLAAGCADKLNTLGLHKQICNRILEPFLYIDTIVTATEWENFYKLRTAKDADPTIQALAKQMLMLWQDSEPKIFRNFNEYHLPYISDKTRELFLNTFDGLDLSTEQINHNLCKISAARCARVSYKPFNAESEDIQKDLKLFKHLKANGHWSAMEHQAKPCSQEQCETTGNFRYWTQFRQLEC